MKKMLLLGLVPVAFLLAGCSTCNKQKMNNLETRVTTLEKQTGASEQKEALETSAAPSVLTVPAPEKPSKKDIQTALKNAGFYAGPLDGKFGEKTKKAIEEFQKSNELKIDGKVGPKTWDKLKTYWSSETGIVATKE